VIPTSIINNNKKFKIKLTDYKYLLKLVNIQSKIINNKLKLTTKLSIKIQIIIKMLEWKLFNISAQIVNKKSIKAIYLEYWLKLNPLIMEKDT
jgi:hypothetical protein